MILSVKPAVVFWQLLLLGYAVLIYWLSDQPVVPVPELFHWQDKVIHAAAYALLALLFWNAWHDMISEQSDFRASQLALLTVLFCGLYGLSDEWHQSFVAGRHASFFDWIADLFGALLLTFTLWKREVVGISVSRS